MKNLLTTETKAKTFLFFDMDGVLADFDGATNGVIETMFEEGFFRTLRPMEEDLNSIMGQLLEEGYTIKILSKACVNKDDNRFLGQQWDKIDWCAKYIPCIDSDDIIIQGADEKKGDILNAYKRVYGDKRYFFLIDDYKPNLLNWAENGGICIKRGKRIKDSRTFSQITSLKELLNN